MDITIVAATEEHSTALISLWEEAELLRPWNDARADIRRAITGPSSDLLLGMVDGQLVASVMVGHDGHRGWLYYLAVAQGARRRGFGRAMVQAGTSWLEQREVPKVQLMVRDGNEQARDFYRALGFERQRVEVLGMVLPQTPDASP